jgi:hypothetical protein
VPVPAPGYSGTPLRIDSAGREIRFTLAGP